MKTIQKVTLLTGLSLLASCSFSKDLMTGLSTTGDGLSAEDVTITVDGEKATDNTFFYGQEIYTNFLTIDGFEVENGKIYPDMSVAIISKQGDTVFQNKNLLGGKAIDGLAADLNANVILAAPIHSDNEYVVKYTIEDTKGDGLFYSEFEIVLEKDPIMEITEDGLSINEAYLFDQDNKKTISTGEIGFDNNVLIDLQGLTGYKKVDGKQNIGMSVLVKDDNGAVIIDMPDVLKNMAMTEAQMQMGLASTLILNKGVLNNPINWKVHVWDKNSDAKLTVQAEIEVK